MASIATKIRQLTPEQYLPRAGNPSDPSLAWSISLNLGLWLSLDLQQGCSVSLYVDYLDSRGEQSLLVDTLNFNGEQETVFSNLIKLPVKGQIHSAALVLRHDSIWVEFSINELFVRVVELPPNPGLYKSA